jgi:hypothetical protein
VVQLRLAPVSPLLLLSAVRGFGRAVTVTVLVGAGFGFLVTRTLTVFVAVAVAVTVLSESGTALEFDPAPKIAPMMKMTTLRMPPPITTACLDVDQSPLAVATVRQASSLLLIGFSSSTWKRPRQGKYRCPSGSRPRVAGSPCRRCCSTHMRPYPNRGVYWQTWCSWCPCRCE